MKKVDLRPGDLIRVDDRILVLTREPEWGEHHPNGRTVRKGEMSGLLGTIDYTAVVLVVAVLKDTTNAIGLRSVFVATELGLGWTQLGSEQIIVLKRVQ